MNKYNCLEDIVAAKELCELIPDGAFAESALVWALPFTGHVFAAPREAATENAWDIVAPAPTLVEILAAITNNGVMVRDETNGTWTVIQWDGLYDKRVNDRNPANAALKLWLDNTKEGSCKC